MLLFGKNKNKNEIIYQDWEQKKSLSKRWYGQFNRWFALYGEKSWKQWLDRLRPFGFTDNFTEEKKTVVERLTNSIIRFASMFHYTINDTNMNFIG